MPRACPVESHAYGYLAAIVNLHGTRPWHSEHSSDFECVAAIVNLHGTSPWSLGGAEPALAESVADQFDAALEIELLHDVGFVSLYRLNTDSEIGCYFLVRVSPGNESQNFRLTLT